MRSCKTLPGPTLSNWSSSPMSRIRQWFGKAFSSCANKWVSTILNSSTIIKSTSNGSSSFFPNELSSRFHCNKEWMVLESQLDSWAKRLLALPVGAHSWIFASGNISLAISKIPFTVVVLPVPGPPVKIMNERSKNNWIASFCSWSYVIARLNSTCLILSSTSICSTLNKCFFNSLAIVTSSSYSVKG